MRTKNERPLRAAGRRRPGKQIVGVSERIRPTASDASVAAIAEGVQAGDMGEVVLYQARSAAMTQIGKRSASSNPRQRGFDVSLMHRPHFREICIAHN